MASFSSSGSSDGSTYPSWPQFQLSLSLAPSRFPSPLRSLCLALNETRSLRVKPSWQVTKLIEWKGERSESGLGANRSYEPATRVASSPALPASPLTNLRAASRNLPFHSAQRRSENDPS